MLSSCCLLGRGYVQFIIGVTSNLFEKSEKVWKTNWKLQEAYVDVIEVAVIENNLQREE